MRHADPHVTVKQYQHAIPAAVKSAAIALEADLLEHERQRQRKAGRRWAMRAWSEVMGGFWMGTRGPP